MAVAYKYPIEDYLSGLRTMASNDLRLRLLSEGHKENRCELCGLDPEWNGETLILELHHIDGNHKNNNLDNLLIVCPNCHAQTDSHRGRIENRPDSEYLRKLLKTKTKVEVSKEFGVSERTIARWLSMPL